VDGEVRAFDNACPHQGMPLIDGNFENGQITCPAHNWIFEASSGSSINPKGQCLTSYPVRVEAGKIMVDVPA